MNFEIKKSENYSIIRLKIEKLDSTISPELKSEFTNLHTDGVTNVIVDMNDVRYADSSGLSALLVGNRLFATEENVFVLAGLNDHVMKLINISQLDKVLEILPTVEEAVDTVFLHVIGKGLIEGEESEQK